MTPIHAEPDSETDVLIVGAGPTGLNSLRSSRHGACARR
jgi:ribulose 1,5-bisphosphate synthetase/thiazole synthase